MQKWLWILAAIWAFTGCRPPVFTPKQVGYCRMDTPAAHHYRLFDQPGYPYTFEYPEYSHTEIDSAFFSEKADNPYWLNIVFPSLGATLNLTYKPITSKEAFIKMVGESFRLSFFHHEKADYIQDDYFLNKNKVNIVLYTVGGDAASRYQFTCTDSTKHFIRGALYFDVSPNADSLKPATDFLEQDIRHLLATVKFR